jgi:hypothetical protein
MKQIIWNRMITILVVMTVLGCGGGVATMTQTVAPSPTPNVKFIPKDNTIYMSDIKKVAVFPFADYSYQQDSIRPDEWGGNIKIQEAILDHLVAHGLSVAVQEDVNTLLVDHDIIRPIDESYLIEGTVNDQAKENPLDNVSSPEYTLVNHTYTQVMRDEIIDIISKGGSKHQSQKKNSPVVQGVTVGLSKEKVVELAQALDVDLIIRGRILDYGIKETASGSIRNSGVIPVVFRGTRDYLLGGAGSYSTGKDEPREGVLPSIFGDGRGFMLGGTESSGYEAGLDDVNNLALGTAAGYAISGGTGALIGAGTGYLVGQQPDRSKRSAVMQIRIYAQNGKTGDVMWSNRVEMEFAPGDNFDFENTHRRVMYDNVVREGVKALMDGFFSNAEGVFSESGGQELPLQKEGT